MKKKNQHHHLIRVVWRNPSDEWPWFWLLKVKGQGRRKRLHLQGADYPNGLGKHDGTKFWCCENEIDYWEYYKPPTESR